MENQSPDTSVVRCNVIFYEKFNSKFEMFMLQLYFDFIISTLFPKRIFAKSFFSSLAPNRPQDQNPVSHKEKTNGERLLTLLITCSPFALKKLPGSQHLQSSHLHLLTYFPGI